MKSLRKISTVQLYMMWKNLATSLLLLIVMMTLSKLMPPIFTPLAALACAAVLYTSLYNHRKSESSACLLIPYVFFICLLCYAFTTIVLNLLELWGVMRFPAEFVFFSRPFVPSLLLNPLCFVCISVMYFRRKKLMVCKDCNLSTSNNSAQNRIGIIFEYESYLQLRNMMLLFGLLSVTIWIYFLVFYIKINANARDWYIFTWLTVIAFLLDEVYFLFRYYNLYLDLKENDEIISEQEIDDMGAQTYVRYYVICENNIYVDSHAVEDYSAYKEVIDTPFQTKRSVNGMTADEVKRIITQMTGIVDGELRFFFGRKNPTMPNSSLLRYFYFIKPLPDGMCPALRTEGEWMDYAEIQRIYSNNPGKLASMSVFDTTRLATIILTEKIFDENGFRKNRLKSYNPTFSLIDVHKSKLNFQEDKWIHISLFNSDTPFFRLKRWWRKITGKSSQKHKIWQ